MLKKETITVVSLRDILTYMEFRSEEMECIMDYGFNTVTYGDASYTLIPAWDAIDRIWQGLDGYYYDLEVDGGDNPSRSIPAKLWTEGEIRAVLEVVLNKNDYVDLEDCCAML